MEQIAVAKISFFFALADEMRNSKQQWCVFRRSTRFQCILIQNQTYKFQSLLIPRVYEISLDMFSVLLTISEHDSTRY